MTTAELVAALRGYARRSRPLAMLVAGALVLVGVPASVAVVGQLASDQRAADAAAVAAAREQKAVDYYRGALAGLDPYGELLVHDSTAWARSGSSLLTAVQVTSLQSTATAVSGVMHRVAAADATSAELRDLFDAQWMVIEGARLRMSDFAAAASAVAQSHLDAAPIADSDSRAAVVAAMDALELAVRNHTAASQQLRALTASVAAVDAAQAAAVAAAEAAAAAAAAAARRGGGGGRPAVTCGENIASYVGQVLALVNVERANAGLSALSSSGSLNSQAQAHATCMAVNANFAHSSGVRGWSTWGENIAQGYGSAASVVSAWMGSAGHRANILNPAFTHMGLGYVASGNWWCQQFGG